MLVELVPVVTVDVLALLPEIFIPQPATLQMEFPPTDALPEEPDVDAEVGCCDIEGGFDNVWCAEDIDGVAFDAAAVDIGIELPERMPDEEFSTKVEPELLGSWSGTPEKIYFKIEVMLNKLLKCCFG